MLTKKEFLSFILPTNGLYCSTDIKRKNNKDKFYRTVDELVKDTEGIVERKSDAYVALASFTDDSSRSQENSKELKCFFMDIDCGPNKDYETKSDGLKAFKVFRNEANLPKPSLLVDSGNGIHVYWVLTAAIPKETWKPIAESLKALCSDKKFSADSNVTADNARILRVPDTFNFKSDIPKPVVVRRKGEPIELKQIENAVSGYSSASLFDQLRKKDFRDYTDPLTKKLQGNFKTEFKTIFKKSMGGVGCAQIVYAYGNQESLEEPMWRAVLSIAEVCTDRSKAIRIMSNKHPHYNEEEAFYKASKTKGPYKCETFKTLNPGGCEGCQHKITSPVVLGKEFIKSKVEDYVVKEENAVTKEKQTYEIPLPPRGFNRPPTGGVYIEIKKSEEEPPENVCVYPYDLYVVKRIHDPEDGESILIRLHLPKDGVREFIVPLSSTLAKDKFLAAVSFHGVTALGKRQDYLMQYVNKSVEKLQNEKKAEVARRQFGWHEEDSVFIYGDKEIKVGQVEPSYSPPTIPTLILTPMFQEKGDFHTWKDIINAYAHEDRIGKAFAFFLGFGGPLMKFVGDGMLDGLLYNLISPGSGAGKSSVLHLLNSIYGNPKALVLKWDDTHNSRMQRLGSMQSLTPTIDEITNMEPKMMSNLIYDITSGRGKNRMDAKANRERLNKTTWSIPVVSTSNTRIRDKLLSIKAFPDAELMRILEDKLPVDKFNDPTWSKAHFGRISKHYGHAIKPYIYHCVNNLPDVIAKLNEVNQMMDRAANIKNTERFWSAGAAVALTGGMIAKDLGLHDIPIKPVFDYCVNLINHSRKSNKDSLTEYGEILGAFLNSHPLGITVVNVGKDKRTGLEMGAIKEPRTSCVARLEKDENRLYVSKSMYQQYCSRNYVSFEDSLLDYKKSGSYIGIKKKRLLAGTSLSSATNSVRCLEFNTKKLDSFDLEGFENDTDNGSSSEDILE
jgi:hypothetical protein|tara:strand:- start:288 stop:3152 length:2865 start_codon:yes stop_codon:yes gene_type:complete